MKLKHLKRLQAFGKVVQLFLYQRRCCLVKADPWNRAPQKKMSLTYVQGMKVCNALQSLREDGDHVWHGPGNSLLSHMVCQSRHTQLQGNVPELPVSFLKQGSK